MTIFYRSIPPLLEEKEEKTSLKEFSEQTDECIPDMNTLESSFYLARQRIENLREQIGKTVEEILELQELEVSYKQELCDLKSIPENLGKPSKIDTFKAAIEGVRVNRIDDAEYNGGEEETQLFSNVNQTYITLFEESWLNTKSFRFLDNQKNVIVFGKKEVSIFDIFDVSDIGKVFHRCTDLARSPIYEEMKAVEQDVYALAYGIQVQFKDKSAKFIVPMRQFIDIPKITMNVPEFIEFIMILPKYAHEKKRFFQKGATVDGFIKYIEKLDVPISDSQKEFLKNLNEKGMLRLYREALENKSEHLVRAYFVNITGVLGKEKNEFLEKLGKFLKKSETVSVTRVLPNKNLPEWMKKIDGVIVEHVNGEFTVFHKPKIISVDPNLNSHVYQEKLFLPSKKILHLTGNEWQEAFLSELRERYKHNAKKFQKYVRAVERGKVELVCTCLENRHQDMCALPVLREVFGKIRHS